MSNSTFSNNRGLNFSGAINNRGTIENMRNMTFFGNIGVTAAAIENDMGSINGMFNTIITGSVAGPDCLDGGMTWNGSNNQSSDDSCPGDIAGAAGNVSMFDTILNDNGCVANGPNGCVRTHALLPGSNALENAVDGTDNGQRGFGVSGTRDIGAFERQQVDCDSQGGTCPLGLSSGFEGSPDP